MSPIPWFKVDDHLGTHPKSIAAGNAAMGLWVRAGAWSAQHLTNGEIATHVLPLLGTPAQARALVSADLWITTADGWRFRDWGDYQPSLEKIVETKQKRREAGRKGGQASAQNRGEGKQT